MTIEIERKKLGRKKFTEIQVDAKSCLKQYGKTYTNSLLFSSIFDNTAWVTYGTVLIEPNTDVDKFGKLNAYTLHDTDAGIMSQIYQLRNSINTSLNYTGSVLIKKDNIGKEDRHVELRIYFTDDTSTEDNKLSIDTKTGEVLFKAQSTAWSYKIIDLGTYWRAVVSARPINTSLVRVGLVLHPSKGRNFVDDPTVLGSAVFSNAQITEGFEEGHIINTTTNIVTTFCTATQSGGGECRNTLKSCQDRPNYQEILKTYSWCTQIADVPKGRHHLPCLFKEPKFTPTQILPQLGASVRGGVTFKVIDFKYHDIGVDPYYRNRQFKQIDQGTYFNRWLANNPYYVNDTVRVKSGYIVNGEFSDYIEKEFIIDTIKTIAKGKSDTILTFKCTDIIKLADKKRTLIPSPSNASLDSNLSSGAQGNFTLAANADLTLFPVTGTNVRIGDEVISYASRSGLVCSTLTRGVPPTIAESHDIGDNVQPGYRFLGNPVAIIHEILTKFTGIDSDIYIPYDAGRTVPSGTPDKWDDEITNWLPGISLNRWIFAPSPAIQYINELCQSFQIDLWMDPISKKIELKTNTPPLANAPVLELNEDINLIKGKTVIKELNKKRISTVIIRYDQKDFRAGDDVGNFAKQHYENAEFNDYGELLLFEMRSRFMNASHSTSVAQTAQRYVARFSTTPREITFQLDAKDATLKTGDLTDITSTLLTNGDGIKIPTRFQIIKENEIDQGTIFEYTGLESSFQSKRNSFFADNTSPQYDAATDAQKLDRAYFSPDTGFFPDGGESYTFI